MRVSRASTVILLLAALTFPGGQATRAAPAENTVPLRLGVMVEEPAEPDRIIRAFSRLLSVLRARLGPEGIQVEEVVIAADLEDLSLRLQRDEVDVVIETVFATQLLRDRSGCLEPRLLLVRDGRREYRSIFFTRKDSPVEKLADLRSRTLVLEAPRSTSAFAVPVAALGRLGIEVVNDAAASGAGREVRYVLAGGEINQAVWVAHRRGDAGAFNEGDWESLPPRIREQLRVFHRTNSILRGLLSFRAGYDPQGRELIEELLVGLHEDSGTGDALERARITRFERLTERDRAGLAGWEEALRSVASAP